jgi:hypothetical protein
MEYPVVAWLGAVIGLSLGLLVFVPLWTREKEETHHAAPAPASEAHLVRR